MGPGQSPAAQYFTYLKPAHGDLGTSQSTGNPVLSDLEKYVPATVELAYRR